MRPLEMRPLDGSATDRSEERRGHHCTRELEPNAGAYVSFILAATMRSLRRRLIPISVFLC
jgi:hypothetical protein